MPQVGKKKFAYTKAGKKKAKKFYKRAKDINEKGKYLAVKKFDDEIDATRRFFQWHS